MIPIYVINLKKDVHKMSHMHEQLSRLNLHYNRFEAVDGATISETKSCIDKSLFKLNYKRLLKAGEIGCAESHRGIWKDIIEKNVNGLALVLEDDVILTQDLNHLLCVISEDTHLDIINLASSEPYNLDRKSLFMLKKRNIFCRPYYRSKKTWQNIENDNYKIYRFETYDTIDVFECGRMPALANAYLINVKACKALLSISQNMLCPIDSIWNYTSEKIRQGFVNPVLITQDSKIVSSIGNRKNRIQLSKKEYIKRQFLKKRKLLNTLRQVRLYGFKPFI